MKEQLFSVKDNNNLTFLKSDLFSYLIYFLINIFYIFLGILFSRFVKINTVKLLYFVVDNNVKYQIKLNT